MPVTYSVHLLPDRKFTADIMHCPVEELLVAGLNKCNSQPIVPTFPFFKVLLPLSAADIIHKLCLHFALYLFITLMYIQ